MAFIRVVSLSPVPVFPRHVRTEICVLKVSDWNDAPSQFYITARRAGISTALSHPFETEELANEAMELGFEVANPEAPEIREIVDLLIKDGDAVRSDFHAPETQKRA